MCVRKLLMHVTVEQGGSKDLTFNQGIDYMIGAGLIPKVSEPYAKHIKDLGNEANHEIREISRAEGERMIAFAELLCQNVYEQPGKLALTMPAGS